MPQAQARLRRYQSPRHLKPHQRQALRFIRIRRGKAGIFMAPGTGKTLVAIRYAEERITDELPALIICRRDDFLTWMIELTNEGVPETEITQIDSSKFDTRARRTRYTMITYDLVKNKSISRWIESKSWAVVIIDESHYIKRWQAERTKKVVKSTRHIPNRIALTGSPITNEVEDVFSQCLFIDNGQTFGDSHWDFKNAYYLKEGPGWYRRRDAKERIKKKLAQVAFSVHEDEVLDLPPKRSIVKGAVMYGAQRREYERILRDWEYKLKDSDEAIEIDYVIVQISKLKQLASGFIYDSEGKAQWFRSGKLELLESLIQDELAEKQKIVVWCSYTAEIERIAELSREKGQGHVVFKGGKRKDKEEARIRFRDDPGVRLFIGQVDSGVGINELTVADTALYFSNSRKVVSRQQSMRRTRRIGSEHHKEILYYDLVTEKSVDIRILGSINRKMDVAHEIVKSLKDKRPIREVLERSHD